jgi:hypothetical protein
MYQPSSLDDKYNWFLYIRYRSVAPPATVLGEAPVPVPEGEASAPVAGASPPVPAPVLLQGDYFKKDPVQCQADLMCLFQISDFLSRQLRRPKEGAIFR